MRLNIIVFLLAPTLCLSEKQGQHPARDDTLWLNPKVIQSGSHHKGNNGSTDPKIAASRTTSNNFINVCMGKTLTNGKLLDDGSCNGIPMGEIPAKDKMVSTIIISPKPGEKVPANKAIDFKIRVDNIALGSFTNSSTTYLAAPQKLDDDGLIIGHFHLTVQNLGKDFSPDKPLDPSKPEFFKGVNDVADSDGIVTVGHLKGLPKGFYRVCTMAAASNHQPVIMPLPRRGAQDDCTKFEAV